jgi:hypothetical protein
MNKPPQPVHVPGTVRGEELALDNKEAGRGEGGKSYTTSRDATGICSLRSARWRRGP